MTGRRFDLVIFDFDGTLASSVDGIAACMGQAFAECGLDVPPLSAVRTTIGLTLEESIRRLTPVGVAVDAAAVARRYRELHVAVAAPAIALFPGATEVLNALENCGIGLVLVSQKARAALQQLLAQFDIDSYFDLVLAADDVTAQKPAAALYTRHIEPHCPGVARDRVLVVGDTVTDLAFAANTGVPSCWAEYGYGDVQHCLAANPTARILQLGDLLNVCGVQPSR